MYSQLLLQVYSQLFDYMYVSMKDPFEREGARERVRIDVGYGDARPISSVHDHEIITRLNRFKIDVI